MEEKRKESLIVGICGGTGSGKTSLARRLQEIFAEDCVLLEMDSYYVNLPHMAYEERCKVNFDHPSSLDTELLIEQLKALKQGVAVDIPQYDFTVHLRKEEKKHLESAKVILVEGILLFENPELASLLDIKIFVDTDADVRILRRAIRDMNERGRTLDSVSNQYLNTVKPMHEMYVEPSKKVADVVIQGGAKNEVAFDMIVSAIRAKIDKM